MLYSFKNSKHLESLEELASRQNQVEKTRLQDKLGKERFQESLKELFEPVTDTIKNTSEKLTKVLNESSIKNN